MQAAMIGEAEAAPSDFLQGLFGDGGLKLLPGGPSQRSVVELGGGLVGVGSRCRKAFAEAPAGSTVIILIRAEETGFARLSHWLLLPFQLAVALRALARHGATLLGSFAVFPDVRTSTLLYELRSPAQRYAERFLVARSPESWPTAVLRKCLSAWAGCDPSMGAVVVIGKTQ
jgi:hypothetical protein